MIIRGMVGRCQIWGRDLAYGKVIWAIGEVDVGAMRGVGPLGLDLVYWGKVLGRGGKEYGHYFPHDPLVENALPVWVCSGRHLQPSVQIPSHFDKCWTCRRLHLK